MNKLVETVKRDQRLSTDNSNRRSALFVGTPWKHADYPPQPTLARIESFSCRTCDSGSQAPIIEGGIEATDLGSMKGLGNGANGEMSNEGIVQTTKIYITPGIEEVDQMNKVSDMV